MKRAFYRYGYELLTVADLARRTQVDRRKLGSFLRTGLSVEEAINAAKSISIKCSRARRFLYRGVLMTVSEAAAITGVSDSTIYERISGDRILEREETIDPYSPGRVDAALITFDGETHTVTRWAEIVGIARETIFSRLFNGWSVARALTTPPQQSGRGVPKARNRRLIKRINLGFQRARNHQIIQRIASASRAYTMEAIR